MKTLAYILVLATILMMGHRVGVGQLTPSDALFRPEALPQIETLSQTNHALELFSRAGYSYLLTGTHSDMRPFILAAVEASLPVEYHNRAFEIARAVIVEANHHNLDPFFLLAVMKTESQFNPDIVGTHGEIGLMQIMPSTATWLAPQTGLRGKIDLRDPATNIRIGATYFAQLRKKFARMPHRYVGAYNMGARNVRRLLASKTEPHIYSEKVLSNYSVFYRDLARAMPVSTTKVAYESRND